MNKAADMSPNEHVCEETEAEEQRDITQENKKEVLNMPSTLSLEFSDQSHDHHTPGNKEEVEKLCIDDMLKNYCGEFGRWQLKHFVLSGLAWTLQAFHTMVMVFADREPNWRCLPGASGLGCDTASETVCGLKPGSWEWEGGRGAASVSQWSLICGAKFKVGLVQAMFFTGAAIGGGIFGHLSDSFLGRKGSLAVACALNTIFGGITALSPKYWTYVVFRFLTGISTGGVGLCGTVLATEPIGPTKRAAAGMSIFYFFSIGIALISSMAYIFQTWRKLYIVSSIPSILYLVLVLPFLSESPRWYLIRGRVSEAKKVMSTIASANGKNLPSEVLLVLDEETTSATNNGSSYDQTNKIEPSENKEVLSGSIVDMIRSPITRIRLILAVVLNFLCAVVYYGLSLNVVNLKTNLYMNVALNAAVEMPAFATTAVLLDRFGRKPMAIGTMWFSGFFCLMGILMRKVKVVRMVCAILGISGIAGTFNLLYIYTAELFPTVVRNTALGCASQGSEMGAILVPILVSLGGWLPFVVFAACGIVGGVLAFFLPETLNKPLYDTFAGLEAGNV